MFCKWCWWWCWWWWWCKLVKVRSVAGRVNYLQSVEESLTIFWPSLTISLTILTDGNGQLAKTTATTLSFIHSFICSPVFNWCYVVCLFVHFFIYISLYIFFYPFFSICLFVSLSVCLLFWVGHVACWPKMNSCCFHNPSSQFMFYVLGLFVCLIVSPYFLVVVLKR